MAEENTPSKDIQELRVEVGKIAFTLTEVKAMLEEIMSSVQTDHRKIEKLEKTSETDQKKLKELDETRKNLEMTGRIQVRPLGL